MQFFIFLLHIQYIRCLACLDFSHIHQLISFPMRFYNYCSKIPNGNLKRLQSYSLNVSSFNMPTGCWNPALHHLDQRGPILLAQLATNWPHTLAPYHVPLWSSSPAQSAAVLCSLFCAACLISCSAFCFLHYLLTGLSRATNRSSLYHLWHSFHRLATPNLHSTILKALRMIYHEHLSQILTAKRKSFLNATLVPIHHYRYELTNVTATVGIFRDSWCWLKKQPLVNR